MKTGLVNICKLTVALALLFSGWSNVSAEVFRGYPDIIVCEAGKGENAPGEIVFYLEGRAKDGMVFYRSPFHRMAVKVDTDGNVHADTPSVNSCLGKSLEELRKSGSTFGFSQH